MIIRSTFVVPTTCPLTFVESRVNFDIYKNRFVQRFGDTDPIRVQMYSTQNVTDTVYLNVISARYDIPIASAKGTFTKSTFGSYYYWDCTIQAATILAAITALGIHYLDTHVYFTITTGTTTYMYSYPVLIQSHAESVGISYGCTRNDYHTIFGTYSMNNRFVWRTMGGFAPGYCGNDETYETFENQSGERSVLRFTPKDTFTLSLDGLSDTEKEKAKIILGLDILQVDGLTYTRVGDIDWQFDSARELWNAKVGMSPATNRMTQNFEADVLMVTQDGTPIANEEAYLIIQQ